jgi:hypothetical protein
VVAEAKQYQDLEGEALFGLAQTLHGQGDVAQAETKGLAAFHLLYAIQHRRAPEVRRWLETSIPYSRQARGAAAVSVASRRETKEPPVTTHATSGGRRRRAEPMHQGPRLPDTPPSAFIQARQEQGCAIGG